MYIDDARVWQEVSNSLRITHVDDLYNVVRSDYMHICNVCKKEMLGKDTADSAEFHLELNYVHWYDRGCLCIDCAFTRGMLESKSEEINAG